jgi:hypothetical protein
MGIASSPPAPLQCRIDQVPQLHHPAADARLDCPERLVEMLGDFRLCHRGKEREFDHLALILRQLHHCLAYQLARFRRRDRIEGIPRVELLETFRFSLHVVLQSITALRRTQAIDGLVPSERYRPGQRFPEGRIVKGRLFPNLDEDILQHVLGCHPIVQHPKSRGKQGARKSIVKLLETPAVALTDPLQKLDLDFEVFRVIRFHIWRFGVRRSFG